MDLLKLNLFRGGLFKQLRYLISTPKDAQKCVYISEAGIVSQEILPMSTGFVEAKEKKKAWDVIHNLKWRVYKSGLPSQDEAVLVITDRSYIPLDPFNTIKSKDKERLTSLKDIARLRHNEARADVGKQLDPNQRIAEFIVTSCFVLLGLFGVIALLKGC